MNNLSPNYYKHALCWAVIGSHRSSAHKNYTTNCCVFDVLHIAHFGFGCVDSSYYHRHIVGGSDIIRINNTFLNKHFDGGFEDCRRSSARCYDLFDLRSSLRRRWNEFFYVCACVCVERRIMLGYDRCRLSDRRTHAFRFAALVTPTRIGDGITFAVVAADNNSVSN